LTGNKRGRRQPPILPPVRPVVKAATPALAARRGPDTQPLRELLLRRRAELCCDWQRCMAVALADDDVLPARQHLEDALVEVDQALQRIQGGRFGACADCAGAIEFDRLIVYPCAARCWGCQQADERGAELLDASLAH
jgi:hypothetical protein